MTPLRAITLRVRAVVLCVPCKVCPPLMILKFPVSSIADQ